MKPKYKDIDWDIMWEIFPEAQAFACDEDGSLHQFKGICIKTDEHLGGWRFKSIGGDPIGYQHYIAKYDLEDVDWKDTLKVKPKKDKMKEFEEKIKNFDFDSETDSFTRDIMIVAKEICRICQENRK